jgi:hypothetical protein
MLNNNILRIMYQILLTQRSVAYLEIVNVAYQRSYNNTKDGLVRPFCYQNNQTKNTSFTEVFYD